MIRKPDVERVREALSAVADPATGGNIIDAGRVHGLAVTDGQARFVLQAPGERAQDYEPVRAAAAAAAERVDGVSAVTAVLTAHADAPRPTPGPGARSPLKPPGVAHVMAVASGKGGVGKSTVAVNLACALARQGRSVGVLDADVYGPSIPTLLGLGHMRPQPNAEGKLAPLAAHGVVAMSMGSVVGRDTAMVWRGPMVMKALAQLIGGVVWGELDVLVMDLPPGTGDVVLSLAQQVAIDGAVIVSTPQELALADVRRGVDMFAKLHVPIVGVIENMSGFVNPATGARIDVFGHGGARTAAEAMGAPFLAEIPLDPALCEASDAGTPLPESVQPVFHDLAQSVWSALSAASRPAPTISVT